MERIQNFNDFLNEANQDEVKLKVDNSKMKKVKEFFHKNTNLFEPHAAHHQKGTQKMKEAGVNVDFPYGYCYPCSQFVFYALDGYQGDWDLKLIKKIKLEKGGAKADTTHWFVQHKTNGTIIDVTKEQFDGVLDIEELYPTGARANLGFPYYNVDGKKKEMGHTVPCMQVLKLYDAYRKEHGKIKGLEKYWSAAKYATTRRKNESYSQAELASIPLNEHHSFL